MPAALLQGKLLSTNSGAMLPSLARLSISTGNNPGGAPAHRPAVLCAAKGGTRTDSSIARNNITIAAKMKLMVENTNPFMVMAKSKVPYEWNTWLAYLRQHRFQFNPRSQAWFKPFNNLTTEEKTEILRPSFQGCLNSIKSIQFPRLLRRQRLLRLRPRCLLLLRRPLRRLLLLRLTRRNSSRRMEFLRSTRAGAWLACPRRSASGGNLRATLNC